MGRTVGSGAEEGIGGQFVCYRINCGALQCFFISKIGQYGGEPFGKHTFAATGRTDEQNVVTACGGDLQGSACSFLPHNFGKVDALFFGNSRKFLGGYGGDALFPFDMHQKFCHRMNGINGNAFDILYLSHIVGRDKDR